MQEKLQGIWNFLDGKKTYLISAAIAIVAALQAAGIEIPTWVLVLMAAGGITTSRMSSGGVDNYYFEEVQKLKVELAKMKTLNEQKK